VPFVRVLGHGGAIGGSLTHKYHFKTKLGVGDEIVMCGRCYPAENTELSSNSSAPFADCEKSAGVNPSMERSRAVEVGNTFLPGDR